MEKRHLHLVLVGMCVVYFAAILIIARILDLR